MRPGGRGRVNECRKIKYNKKQNKIKIECILLDFFLIFFLIFDFWFFGGSTAQSETFEHGRQLGVGRAVS